MSQLSSVNQTDLKHLLMCLIVLFLNINDLAAQKSDQKIFIMYFIVLP